MRFLIVTSVPSPFQVELVEECNRSHYIKGDVWFEEELPLHRGKHWLSSLESENAYFNKHHLSRSKSISLKDLLCEKRYDVILLGLSIKFSILKKIQPVIEKNIPIIIWNEQPNICSLIIRKIKDLYYSLVIGRVKPIAIFGIGDRACLRYREIYDVDVYLFPYYQKLNYQVAPSSTTIDGIRFVFSGRFIERNNINQIVLAIQHLVLERKVSNFEVSFFGSGECNEILEMAKNTFPDNIQLLTDDVKDWDSRLEPIRNADVLLSPGNHSGWGLTLPEALSQGKPVISTTQIESARFFIKDGYNGYLVNENYLSIARAMEVFIKNPWLLKRMAENCVRSSKAGSVERGVFILENLLSKCIS